MVLRRYRLPLAIAGLSALIGLAGLVLHPAKAYATVTSEFLNSTNTASNQGSPWTDAYENVAWRGNEYDAFGNLTKSIGLEARVSLSRVFYNIGGPGATSRNTFTIRIVDACNTDRQVWQGDIVVSIQGFNGSSWSDLPGRSNIPNTNPANCQGMDMLFTVTRAEVSSLQTYYGLNYGIVQVRVEKVNGIGTKFFRTKSEDDGLVTFSELERAQTASPGNPGYGTAFSMQDGATVPASDEREYMFTFSPDCRYVPEYGNTGYLKWFDADFGDGNEFGSDNLTFTLTRRNRLTGLVTWQTTINQNTFPDIGGDDQFRETSFPITGPDDVFEWHWYNVNKNNGIQLWMPFSEMQYNITALSGCDEPPSGQLYTADCNVITGWASDSDRPNDAVQVVLTQDGPYGSGAEIGRIAANQPDSQGHGNHAFSIPYFGVKDAAAHTVYATTFGLDDNGVPVFANPLQLPGSPIQVGPCALPAEFILEPVVNTVNLSGDEESPGSVTINSAIIPTGVTQAAGVQGTATRYITIRRASGAVTTTVLASTTQRFTAAGRSFSDIYPAAAANLQAGDEVCAFITSLDTYHGMADIYGNTTQVIERQKVSSSICRRIVSKPYVKAYGGDVRAGGDFGAGVCTPAQAGATIKTFAKQVGMQGEGSSVEFAAFALGLIDYDTGSNGFYSASQRLADPQPITGLTFANTVGGWGGNFGAADHCITDFAGFGSLPTTKGRFILPSTDISILGDGQYIAAAGATPITLTASGDVSNHVAIFVSGDVFIQKAGASPGIRYRPGPWATAGTTPSLAIISEGGNIYVDYNISQLDGMFIAEPDPANRAATGKIFTCADPATKAPFDSRLQQGRFFDAATGCAKSALVVNGAFVANDVRLQRSVNSLRDAFLSPGETPGNTRAAEVFNLSPELYISEPAWDAVGVTNTGAYDSIVTLPPTF